MSSSPPPVLSDSDWSKRTTAISFRRLMRLEPHRRDSKNETRSNSIATFRSTSAAYPPTHTHRTYGGHVIAQAAWAAAHTVPHGLHVHSITGHFLSIGDTRYAFEYRVRSIRDGGVYASRVVDVYQDLGDGAKNSINPMFVCIVSFKRDESAHHRAGAKKRRRDFESQQMDRGWLQRAYGNQLRENTKFEDVPVCQGMDAMWPRGYMTVAEWRTRGDVFPGLEMRKVDMGGYNGVACEGALADEGDVARRWRLLLLYRLIVEDGEAAKSKDDHRETRHHRQTRTGADDDLNLHACAHIYASDRNSLFLTQRALGFQDTTGHIGSLSHTVNFHGGAEGLRMISQSGGSVDRRKEFVQESWMSNSGDDRVCHESRIWDRKTGKIVASTVQDGMMRIPVEQEYDIMDGEALIRREAKL